MEFIYSQRGKKLILHEGFKFYRYKVKKAKGWQWRCTNRNCRAKLYINDEESIILNKEEVLHNHNENQRMARQIFSNNAKRKATENISERPCNIMRKESLNLNNHYHNLTNHDLQCARRCVYRARKKEKLPHLPKLSEVHTLAQLIVNPDFNYSRSDNPAQQCLEESIASLESAKYALCFSSGLAARLALTHLLNAGDHIVCFDDVYKGTNQYFRTCATKMGIKTFFVDMTDTANLAEALNNNTKMVWVETPSNPSMKLVDIEAVAKLLKNYPDVFLVIDNTFMSPYFQLPLKLGADVVIHSLANYINGHSDAAMGALATNNEDMYNKLKFLQNSLGCIPSSFDCFLVNRGIKTIHIRMQRHHENALAVANFLENHPLVEKVLYPGLESHPQYKLAIKQCSGFSGMVTFYIKGGLEESKKFVVASKVFTLAENLGGVESLLEVPSFMTHSSVPEEQRKMLGLSDNLIRLSVGIESISDILEDLDQALAKAVKA